MLKRRIVQSFFMEVIILMTWAIWHTRNGWIFKNEDPPVDACKRKFIKVQASSISSKEKKNFSTIEHAVVG
jgi:hypothetical protein